MVFRYASFYFAYQIRANVGGYSPDGQWIVFRREGPGLVPAIVQEQGTEEVTEDNVTYNAPPHRFEAGTPPIAPAVALA